MRIIGGVHKGRVIKVPASLPVRPTTDFAKEGLFNILHNRFDIPSLRVLDLFSGTGHLSMEFASRGASSVNSVDKDVRCVRFLTESADQLQLSINTIRSDVFSHLRTCNTQYDLIFADPPYDLPNFEEIHQLVFEKDLLAEGGTLIIEHGPRTSLDQLKGFRERRKYGNVNFSFFEKS